MLTSKQRAYLRSLGSTQNAIFQIGKGGLAENENLFRQLDDALEARELIKVTVLETALLGTREACTLVCERLNAEPVQCIGNKFVIYRESVDKKKIELPR